MDIIERHPGDRQRLRELIRREQNARQRDRYRMVALALDGEEKLRIAALLGVAKSTVEKWVYRYRDHGVEALRPIKQPGATPKLDPAHHDRLRARLDAGATTRDGVCTLRGRDVQRILQREFGVRYSLTQAYAILHKLGYECLSPRPRHERRDPEAHAEFKRITPLFSGS